MQLSPELPIRLTVCDSAEEVRRVVGDLYRHGFTTAEISVVCSQSACEQEFAKLIKEHPAGKQVDAALNRSAAVGAGLGAAAVIAGLLTTTGIGVVVIGSFAGLAIAETFASLMMTRGAEKELADYYDQAVSHGKILVAVETTDPARQRLADSILHPAGDRPVGLPKEDVVEPPPTDVSRT
jgi:hypothetical protein